MKKTEYTREEMKLFHKMNSPQKIQDYLNSLPFNFEEGWGTCMSPRKVLEMGKADCLEGAIFAAVVLEFHGHKPLLLDLRSTKKPYDYDHVVAVFKQFDCFGAISKTNHGVLRYREPVYKTVRELVISFFHEYFLDNGKKTLREYSELLDLSKLKCDRARAKGVLRPADRTWRTSEKDIWQVHEALDKIKHYPMLSKKQIKNLRKADKIEITAGKLVEWKKSKN
ncbi:MAG TPA: hypothetical protein VJC13_02805 [Candidatus Paceibacterota bacterium]|nr:hypothetical protein [uncultured archaeon]